jgi:hypothetical protein
MQFQLIDMLYINLLPIRFVNAVNGRKREIERDNSENGTYDQYKDKPLLV